MKKVIFLIAYSNDLPVYHIMRDIGRRYFQKMQATFGYQYFFLEHKMLEGGEAVRVEGDMMYVNGTERYWGILNKTMKAYEYINRHFDYDIVIRTTVASFWNFYTMYPFLDGLQEKGIATGICNDVCISGTGIILSRDVCEKLCEVMVYDESAEDDVIIRRNLQKFMTVQPITLPIRCDLVCGPPNHLVPVDISQYVYFRVKCWVDRMAYDIPIFVELAKRIYDIDVTIQHM